MTKNLRLNDKGALFLELVRNSQSLLCGMDIVEKSGQVIRRGSVFAIASNLEGDGYITSHKEENPASAIPRRLYKITPAGRIVLKAWHEINSQKGRSSMLAIV